MSCFFFYPFKIKIKGTQALVRPGSPNSSLSADDRGTLAAICTICKAKALVDSNNPYDKDALKFKVSC